jgi:hypothetical protein
MDTPFGVAWAELDLASLRAYFDHAEPGEGLTWEAKADDVRPAHIYKAASGFGNSVSGGYLVLGATWDKRTHQWKLPGVALGPEPQTWVSNLVSTGVRPVPHFDCRVLDLGSGTSIVVVWFEPVPDPPCITTDGRIYERTVGVTQPVTVPNALARLFERGERARRRAEEAAKTAARIAYDSPPGMTGPALYALAVAPVGLPGDVRTAIFRRSFINETRRVLFDTMKRGMNLGPSGFEDVRQDWIAVWWGYQAQGPGPLILVTRDGAAAVAYVGTGQGDGVAALYDNNLEGPWTAAVDVVRNMGGHGPAYLHLAVQLSGATGSVERWVSVEPPTEAERGSMLRELQRLRGSSMAYEPEIT